MIRFGFAGCGTFIEKCVLPNMANVENAQAVAVFDMNRETMKRVCENFNIKNACNSFDDLLADDNVDVIYIASPNIFHKDQAIAAAKAGKHVFCQKPMSPKTADCVEMIEACNAAGVKMGIGFCYPFSGPQQKVKQMIDDGTLGDVSLIKISFSLCGLTKENVGWRCDPKLSGGGPMMDLVPHLVNFVCSMYSAKVKAVMGYVEPELTTDEIERNVVAILEMDNGKKAMIDASFDRLSRHHYRVIGNKGEIAATNTMRWEVGGEIIHNDCQATHNVEFEHLEAVEEELRQFCDAIEAGNKPPVSGEAGLHAQEVIDAIYESGKTGKVCKIKHSKLFTCDEVFA